MTGAGPSPLSMPRAAQAQATSSQRATAARRIRSVAAEAGCGQRDIGARPGFLEAGFDERRLIRFLLRAERLQQSEERPAVLAITPQIVPVDRFRFRGPSRLEQHGAKRMARREM